MKIAVAGCGPAGMAAALLPARDGHEVTVYERFAAAQPLGSGLMIQPTGLAVLQALGLGERLVGMAAPIERPFGRAAGTGAVVLDVRSAALERFPPKWMPVRRRKRLSYDFPRRWAKMDRCGRVAPLPPRRGMDRENAGH